MTSRLPTVTVLLCLLGTALSLPSPSPSSGCVPPCPSPEALYPNPRDCATYFHCAHNIPHLKYCPAGQEYFGAKLRCDYPQFAQCEASQDAACEAVTFPTAAAPNGTAAPARCTPKCPHSNAYMPHPQDCTKFYTCDATRAWVNLCQEGLHYNKEKMWCDYPDEANCVAGPQHACDELLLPSL